MRSSRRWATCALLVASGASCDGGPARIQRPTLGQPLADVSLEDTRGNAVAIADLAGQPALVNLWATWCPPCREETPFLQSLHERLSPRGLQIVGITVDNAAARSAVDEFLAENGVEYLQLVDPRGVSMDLYGVIGLPATFLIDAEGIVRFARLGPVTESDPEFERALTQVLDG